MQGSSEEYKEHSTRKKERKKGRAHGLKATTYNKLASKDSLKHLTNTLYESKNMKLIKRNF